MLTPFLQTRFLQASSKPVFIGIATILLAAFTSPPSQAVEPHQLNFAIDVLDDNYVDMSLGETISRNLDPGNYYTFRIRSNRSRSVSVRTKEANFDTVCRVFNSRGQQIMYDDDGGPRNHCGLITQVGTETFYITVQGVGNQAGDFQLEVRDAATVSGAAANDCSTPVSIQSASFNDIQPGTSTQQIKSSERYFAYRLNLNAGDQVSFRTQGNMDTLCRFYHEGYEQAQCDDDSGPRFNCNISRTINTSGEFYITVQGFGQQVGQFAYSLSVTPGANNNRETIRRRDNVRDMRPADEAPRNDKQRRQRSDGGLRDMRPQR